MTEPSKSAEPAVTTDPAYEPPELSPLGSVHAQTLITQAPS